LLIDIVFDVVSSGVSEVDCVNDVVVLGERVSVGLTELLIDIVLDEVS